MSQLLAFSHLQLMDAITRLHKIIEENINFETLIPFLNKYKIFTTGEMKYFINKFHSDADKVANLLIWLEAKNEKGIYDFVRALNEAVEHSGHIVILEHLQKEFSIVPDKSPDIIKRMESNNPSLTLKEISMSSEAKDKKERKIPKENLRYTLDDLILRTKDLLEGFDNNTLDKHSHQTIINGVRLLLMVVNSSEFYAAMNYFSRSEAKKLESDGDIYYVGKWGKISAALVQQSRPGISGSDGAQQLTIASINLFKNLEVIIALGVCGTIGRLGDVIVSSQIDGCDNIKIVGNNIHIINRAIKANPGRKIYKHLKQNHEIWSFLCTKQQTEMHKAKAVIKPMLSGVHLVASAEYREKLKESVNPEAGGLEMEGIGVIHGIESAKKKDKVEFIIVKAGCDYADEYKSKEWQPVAAMAAADFVYHQLSKPNWLSDIS